jgi:hypothetical protein
MQKNAMKTNATSKKRSKTQKRTKTCVFFGFNKSDFDDVGYLGKDLTIVKERKDAKQFSLKGKKSDGFVPP